MAQGGSQQAAGSGTADDAGVVIDETERVFDREVLHEVVISTEPANITEFSCPPSDVYVSASVTFDGMTFDNVGIRNKGASSCRVFPEKMGFNVKFNEFVSGQKLFGLSKLTLNSTIQDPTWVDEILTYDTYRRVGLPAQRVAHAVVTFNGTAMGIYNLIEPINPPFLARNFGNGIGNLYEGPWDFTKPTSDISLKDEITDMRTREDLEALTAVVLSEADTDYTARLEGLLDVDRFLLLHAVDMVTVAWDGYPLDAWNFYLYDNPQDGRFVFIGTGANWPYFTDNMDAAVHIDPFGLPPLWPNQTPAETGFISRERVLMLPDLLTRLQAAMTTAIEAFDVPTLWAAFDRSKRVINSTDRTDAATQADLATFNDHVQQAYDFVEQRKAFLMDQQ
jgi:spore coat protein CotH